MGTTSVKQLELSFHGLMLRLALFLTPAIDQARTSPAAAGSSSPLVGDSGRASRARPELPRPRPRPRRLSAESARRAAVPRTDDTAFASSRIAASSVRLEAPAEGSILSERQQQLSSIPQR